MEKHTTRFLSAGSNSFFLFGPRGTGKTIWIRQQKFENAIYIDLNDERMFCDYMANPLLLREQVLGRLSITGPCNLVVVVDEIQKLPKLLNTIHNLIVDFKDVKFILTGSSTRKIKRQNENLLGGRASIRHMHPFMASELGVNFDLEKALKDGLVPLVFSSSDKQEALSGYIGAYLREEVKHEGLVRNLSSFFTFLESASFSHASIPNMASIARECGVSAVSVKTYFEILEELLISFSIPVFSKRAQRKLSSKSKFYFFDAGVYRKLRPKGPIDKTSEIDGHALEGLIGQHLRAWCDYSIGQHRLYYWRTKSKVEVDFVLYGENEFVAVEVKNTHKIRQEDLRGLKSFAEDYPEATLYLLYRGQDILKKENILCLPCEYFLKNLKPSKIT